MKKKLFYGLLFLVTIPFYAQTIPAYYNGLDFTKTGDELFLELSTRIIDTHEGIPYTSSSTDVWDACKLADEDPDISTNVLLIYGFDDTDGETDTDRTRDKNLQDTGGTTGTWNREHVFAKSLAFPSLGTDEPGPGTDVHNLRPADTQRNSLRSNRFFTDGSGVASYIASNGEWYPGDEWKGDVARIVMYMYLRYNGDGSQISETKCLPINIGKGDALTIDPNMVDLFLKWNAEDPVSDFEANRNEVLFGIQKNRNPFIDNPYLATLIWEGLIAEDKWNMGGSSDTESPTIPSNLSSSNITDESFEISWVASTDNIGVYDYSIYVDGIYIQTSTTTSATIIDLDSSTDYSITIKARDASSNYSDFSTPLVVKTLEGPTYLFEEDFEDCSNLKFVSYNEASNKNWICNTQFGENNSGSININGYQQDVLSKDWLITTNPIDFDNSTSEKLSFYTDAAYGDSPLFLVYSSDYDGVGNPVDYTWEPVSGVSIPLKSEPSGNEEIFTFKDIDISSITGAVYFAFKYYSNDSPTRWTVDSFEIIVDDNPDIDGDGVLNEDDLCPNTPAGEIVNGDGCSNGQLDDDNDGVQNSDDECENTPTGEEVNEKGCSESQIDDDDDGVMNDKDACPNTPTGEVVDENGCSYGQLDDDNDGVQNSDDTCADTPTGEEVNASGCSESQIDDDEDGVMNDKDDCPNTPTGEVVDENGCSESQLDDDGDGVMNDKDQCSNTPLGTNVDAVGCFTLNSDNFKVETISETCTGSSNGKIIITAVEDFNYKTTIAGTAYSFTNSTSLEVENLAATNYEFCISVDGESYDQCFNVIIDAGFKLAGKIAVNSNKATVEILEGTAPFNVILNGEMLFQTMNSSFEIDVLHGDLVEVKTSKDCEGNFSKEIDLIESIAAYPNPTKGKLEIGLPIARKEVVIELYNLQSQLISRKTYPVVYGRVQLNIEEKPAGIYIAKVLLSKPTIIKIVKE